MNKLSILSKIFGNKVDPEELAAYRSAVPSSIDVTIFIDEQRFIATVDSIEKNEINGLLITEADSHDHLVDAINDLILTYKNVPVQYRSHFSRLLLPQDPRLFNKVREGQNLTLVKGQHVQMGIFYRNSSYSKILKFLRKNEFVIDQGARHTKAAHPNKDGIIVFPRHTDISNGTTEKICKQLVSMGFDSTEIKKSILK